VYGRRELDLLQQVLFYKELGFPLEEIRSILYAPGYDRGRAFQGHLEELIKKRGRLDVLITNVTKSISAMKGEISMTDKEKFEGFKQSLIDENEEKYGEEARKKYGDKAVDASNAKLKGLTQEQYYEGLRLQAAYEEKLKAAFESGDPGGGLAQAACDLHRQWLCVYYPGYSREYHVALGEMYVADERFKANNEKIAPGCTAFFLEAIRIYCK
jgi:DNA-binding transcriptional MerR regulator